MAEELRIKANLETNAFERGLEKMSSSVSRFGRRAPRMAAGAVIGGGVSGAVAGVLSGGGASAVGLGGIHGDVGASRGFWEMTPGEAKVLSDLGNEKAINLLGIAGRFEADQAAMRAMTSDPSVYQRMGYGGYERGDTAIESMLKSFRKVNAMPEGDAKNFHMEQLGLKELVKSGLTEEEILKRLEYPHSEVGTRVSERGEEYAGKAERSKGWFRDFFDRLFTQFWAELHDAWEDPWMRDPENAMRPENVNKNLFPKTTEKIEQEKTQLLERIANAIEDIRGMEE